MLPSLWRRIFRSGLCHDRPVLSPANGYTWTADSAFGSEGSHSGRELPGLGTREGSPRERQPTASWGDREAPVPVDPHDEDGRYRTSSRRRALDRGQDEPVDAYLPRWALESGVRHADGGGRHAAPDEDEQEPERPTSGAGRRSAEPSSSRRRGSGTGRREQAAIGAGPDSDHTRSGRSTVRRSRATPVAGAPTPVRTSRFPALSRTDVLAAHQLVVHR
ncbi:hypothetical protein NKG94_36290 [Micromonospora sp. M12]